MSLTAAQNEAVAARGNVLVVAGAGTGKTSTLVERCLNCLLEEQPPASLDEILMVTFTDAAAAEMRQRIRARLEEKMSGHSGRLRWAEELALFDTAHIGTLHSFCLQLVRQHFYELGLDPQLNVLPEEEAKLLAGETLEKMLQAHYAGKDKTSEAVRELIQTQARGWDLPIRQLVLRLHHYTQTLRDAEGWLASQLAMFASPEPAQWQLWLLEGVAGWRERWLPALRAEQPENLKAGECEAILKQLPGHPTREQCSGVPEQVHLASLNWPRGKKTSWLKPLEGFFDEAAFLASLAKPGNPKDPLTEDWNWVRPQMAALLKLAQEFTKEFSEAKRELGALDFHDLEQHALRLLWDPNTKQPTAVARQWRSKLRFVFVDEYQDINDAQDAILKALSREGADANRFLVGDVKQSIYRFRLADPHIFQNYVSTWRTGQGKVIPLVDNFRSREAILKFVNSLFASLMRLQIGNVEYDEAARLRFGAPENRAALSQSPDDLPRIEFHLRLKGGGEAAESEAGDAGPAVAEIMNLEEAGKEARLVALRLRELKLDGHLIWDESSRSMRPVEWDDMAILLRSPSGKAEAFAKEFAGLGIPLTVARGGFYESREITDFLSLLHLLDNPLQDLPVLAALRSPLVGMTLNELAAIRLTMPKGHFWAALQRFHEAGEHQSGWVMVDRFLKNFAAWRRLARQVSLSHCLEAVLGETHYSEWLLTQPRGRQRHANLRRLLTLAQQFDQFQRQGLFRFLRFVEAQQEAETEPEAKKVAGENAVALMSIHQSKGLEFPVVVVADLGKPFNLSDLRAEIILDSHYGLCPHIKPPHTGRRYPSLPYWLARQRQRRELLGEEMRLLYVAMTRARDTLILSGNVSEKRFQKQWRETAGLETTSLLAAKSYLDWLAAWFTKTCGEPPSPPSGKNDWMSWTVYDDLDKRLLDTSSERAVVAGSDESTDLLDAESRRKLHSLLAWRYPHLAATQVPAKTSVSVLRRRLAVEGEAEAAPAFKFRVSSAGTASKGRLSAEEIGTAHHTFLELVALADTGTLAGLKLQAQKMEAEGVLTAEEIKQLDFAALGEFWQSELGGKIRAQAGLVQRELAFSARFTPEELKAAGEFNSDLSGEEFIVVQGAADLVVLLPKEIWLVDFKTDRFPPADLPAKVKMYEPQLRLYSLSLSRVYRRPVSQVYLHFLAVGQSVALQTLDLQFG